MTSRARLAKLEARHNPRRGCLTVREVAGSGPVEFVATSRGSNGQRWAQQPGESVAALVDRIAGDAPAVTLIYTDRQVLGVTTLQRAYGRGARFYLPDNGRDP